MSTARYLHTATLLPSGKVLVAGGGNDLASAELYDPAPGTWSPTGSMVTGRELHTATLLPSGKVLVAGGSDSSSEATALAELYDPLTGIWSGTGSMATARFEHTATLLPSGKVLVAGGANFFSGALASAELYDPALGNWSPTGGMANARYLHTATLLPSGKVLVAGGLGTSGTISSAELYDPATGTWSGTSSMATARDSHTATLLPSGRVLVAGGENPGGVLASAELYDPASGTWSGTGSMATPRFEHTATLLPSGKVLVAGGAVSFGNALASAELYDPASGTWSGTGSMATARSLHTATLLLSSGKVLVAGGYNGSVLASAELYEEVGPAQPTLTTLATPTTSFGQSIQDNATLLGTSGPTAGGTISFSLFGPSDPHCTGVPINAGTAAVHGDGIYSSSSIPIFIVGTWHWIAGYSGDPANSPASTACNDPGETSTVTKASTGLSTVPQPRTGTVGMTLNDDATLSGGVSPTGTLTISLFAPNTGCIGSPAYTDVITVNGAATYHTATQGTNPGGFVANAVGIWAWTAAYSGDNNNFGSSTSCGSELVTVTQATPTLRTAPQPASATVGTTLNDNATLSGGFGTLSGTLTISLFPPLTGCVGTPAYTDVISVNGAATYHTATQGTNPGGFVANAVGIWAWTAAYSGDANNAGSSTSCGSELVTVTQATPTLSTAPQPASATVGTTLNDDATLSGGFGTLSGTLTISLFSPGSPSCITPVYTDVITVNGAGTYHTQNQGTPSGGFATNAVGTWQWTAVYSGDANNAGSSAGCGSEPVTVSQAHPTLSTAPQPSSATAGTPLNDKANIAGGASPTGTITFTLYAPSDPTCAAAAIFTDPVLVSSGNGTYSTSVGYPAGVAGTYHWRASYSGDPNNASASSACADEPVVVSAGPPATLVLTPPAATNTVGQQHCVTATVKDAFGNPVSGVVVDFSVGPSVPTTFPTPSSGTGTTSANGQATFCYTAALPGVDAIHAFADTSGNGRQDFGEPFDDATKTWTPPASTQLCEVTITDGGWITADTGDRANFGGNAKVSADGTPQGQEEYQDQGPAQPVNVHSIQITATTCSSERTTASIYGKATIDGAGSHVFRIDVTDMGSGGTNDSYGIMLDTGYMSGQHVLGGGNITIH